MLELNQRFLELYKRTDHFIRDAYSSRDGISKYIELMEANRFKGTWKIQSWTEDYKMLKHVRWIRNQYAHEISYDSNLCEDDDYYWLDSFYKRLYSANDPLAILNRIEQKEQRTVAEQRKQQKAFQAKAPLNRDKETSNKNTEKLSIWKRIRKFFFGALWD